MQLSSTNKQGLAMVVLSGVDHEDRNVLFGFGFLRNEDIESYSWLLRAFKGFHGGRTGVLLSDFDSSITTASEEVFERTEHLLCQWHMMQNFKKHFMFLLKNKNWKSRKLHASIMELIFEPEPLRFQFLQEVIFENPDELIKRERLLYLKKMLLLKEKWASGVRAPDVHGGPAHDVAGGVGELVDKGAHLLEPELSAGPD